LRIGKETGSALLQANAWHHRSDALSSVVALVGIGAAQLGFVWGDPLAALVIAAMLVKIGWGFGAEAAVELVDTQPDDGVRAALQSLSGRNAQGCWGTAICGCAATARAPWPMSRSWWTPESA
jgi:divalent metal cation (Fe/Co/Zn/Cd) transporter